MIEIIRTKGKKKYFYQHLISTSEETFVSAYNYKQEDILKQPLLQPDTPNFSYEDIVLLETLGEGGYGKVRKAYNKKLEKYVAIKTFKIDDKKPIFDILEEIKFEDDLLMSVEMIRKKHKNSQFLEYYGIYKDPQGNKADSLLLEMESGIATLDDILSVGKSYNCEEIFYVLRRLVKGYSILQENGIANRDIKAQNIILVENGLEEDSGFDYRISDFGIGCKLPINCDSLSSKEIKGLTKQYVSPEIIEILTLFSKDKDFQQNYNPFKSDVYSLGIIALRMIDYKIRRKFVTLDGFLNEDEKIKHKDYETLFNILQHMLVADPSKRFDFIQLNKLFDDKLNYETMPKNEWKYYLDWINQKEEKQAKTAEEIFTLYQEHDKLFDLYENDISGSKKALFHILKAIENLKKLKNKLHPIKTIKDKENNLVGHVDLEELFSIVKYGQIMLKNGDLNKTEEILFQGLEICQKFIQISQKEKKIDFDPQYDASYLTIYNNLGLLYNKKGDLMKAEEYYLKALKSNLNAKSQEGNGEVHPGVGELYSNLGNFYNKKLDYKKAEECFLASMNFFENMKKKHHNLMNYNNIGQLYIEMGDYKKSEEYLLKGLEIQINFFGKNHIVTCSFYHNLGMLYHRKADLKTSLDYYLKSLKIKINLNGENHNENCETYHNLGSLYYELSDFKKAEDCFLKVLKIKENLSLQNDPLNGSIYSNLGCLYEKMGDFDKAKDFYLKSLENKCKNNKENHPDSAVTYDNLGNIYNHLEDFSKAEEYHNKALKIFLNFFGENHAETATCLTNISNLNYKMKNYKKAEEYQLKSLKIHINLYGDNSLQTYSDYNNLGVYYAEMGDFKKSEEYQLKSLRLQINVYGENYGNVAVAYSNLGTLYYMMGNVEKAIEFHLTGLRIKLKLFGENHWETRGSYNNLGIIYQNIGDIKNAVTYFLKAMKKY